MDGSLPKDTEFMSLEGFWQIEGGEMEARKNEDGVGRDAVYETTRIHARGFGLRREQPGF